MKKGDKVMVISENAKHYEMKGIIDEIKGNEALIKFPDIKSRIMYYAWNLHLEEEAVNTKIETKDYYMIFDNNHNKIGRSCLTQGAAIEEAKSMIKDNQKLYIFKCIGEVNSKIIKTTNSIIY